MVSDVVLYQNQSKAHNFNSVSYNCSRVGGDTDPGTDSKCPQLKYRKHLLRNCHPESDRGGKVWLTKKKNTGVFGVYND